MKLRLHLAATSWDGGSERLAGTLGEIVAAAEVAGFDAISVTVHVWGSQYTGGVEASQVEAYTTLGFIAARTRRARLLAPDDAPLLERLIGLTGRNPARSAGGAHG